MFPEFKHRIEIPKGKRGTIDKCREELAELEDASKQGSKLHIAIEAADLINSTYTYAWQQHRIPVFVVRVLALVTAVYKPVVRYFKRKKNHV